jgi:ribosomal protein S18 acetylase RimI-like enzyme
MSDFALGAGDTLSSADLHAATLAAFADYLIGPFQMTLAQWPSFIGRQGIDLAASRVALRCGRAVAFAFVAPRPEIGRWRLAVMGALPEARGTGAAPGLLDNFIERAATQGLPEVELECFAENERALKLYRSRGFDEVQALRGWKAGARAEEANVASAIRAPADDASAPAPRAVDRNTAFAWLAEANRRIRDLPFPVTPSSLQAQVRPLTFWQQGSAQLVFSIADGTPIQVHSLVDPDAGQRDAQSLLRALRSAHPDAEIDVPQLQRDDLGGEALRREGFAPNGMHQVLMRRRLR